eukprot:1153260-Pelagomonas_calceolata.AAC.2
MLPDSNGHDAWFRHQSASFTGCAALSQACGHAGTSCTGSPYTCFAATLKQAAPLFSRLVAVP